MKPKLYIMVLRDAAGEPIYSHPFHDENDRMAIWQCKRELAYKNLQNKNICGYRLYLEKGHKLISEGTL